MKKMRKLIAFVAVISMLCTLFVPGMGYATDYTGATIGGAGGGGSVGGSGVVPANCTRLEVSDSSITVGETSVSVDINMPTNKGLVGMVLDVEYDESVLTLVEVIDGGILGSNLHSDNYTSPYKLTWANDTIRNNITTTGKIVTLKFDVKADAVAGDYPIEITNYEITDVDMEFLACIIADGNVAIKNKEIKGVTLSNKTVTFNGDAHSLEPTGLFEGVSVTKTHYGATDGSYDDYEPPIFAGEYIVNMTVAGEGYEDLHLKAMLYINEVKVTLTVKDVRFSICGNGVDLPMPECTSNSPLFNEWLAEGSIVVDFSCPEADAAMVDGKYTAGTYKIEAEVSEYDVEGCFDVTVVPGRLIITNTHAATYKVAKAATCTEDGNIAHYYCTGCKKNFEDAACTKEIVDSVIIPALGHEMTEYAAKDATCTDDGNVAYYNCPACKNNFKDIEGKEKINNVVIPSAHKLEKVEAVANTCTTDGNVEYYKCNGECGKNYSDIKASKVLENVVIPAAHTLTKVGAVAKTCTTPGNVEYYKCSGTCGKNYKDEKASEEIKDVVVPASHELEKVDAKEKTCTTDGNVEYYKCNGECEKLYTTYNATEETTLEKVTIPASHGETVVIPGIDATCKNVGLTEGKKCTICGVATVVPQMVKKLAHTEKIVEGKPATCTESGLTDGKVCSTCDTVIEEQKVVEASGHNWSEWDTTDPTKKVRICLNDCGEKEEYEIVEECEHKETKNVEKVAATCEKTGVSEIYCATCGELVGKEEIAIVDHVMEDVAEKSPSCVADGNIAYKHCSLCDKNFVDGEIVENIIIEATGHTWGDADVNGVQTCTVNGCNATKKVAVTITTPEVSVDIENLDGVLDEGDDTLANNNAEVTPEMNIEEVNENDISEEIKDVIDSTKIGHNKIIVEIKVKKNVSYDSGLNYEVEVKETPALVKIEVSLPASLQDKVNYYVARVHDDLAEKITTTPNADGEYIVIDKTNNKIMLHVKKFSEYAIVGDNYVAPSGPAGGAGGGGGAAPGFTVKFETNGGSEVAKQSLKKKEVVTEPQAPVKDGYTFAGWYTDEALTNKYVFGSEVTNSFTLYAKWIAKPVEDSLFADVKSSDWYYDAVKYANDNKLMNGVSADKFDPNGLLTRAMLVTVLYRNKGEPATNRSIPFADIDMGAYYANAVLWAQQNNIVNGTTETTFAPNDNITREQIATIIFRYAQYKGMDAITLEENLHFADSSEISEYAVSAMNWAVGSGLMKGKTDSTLNPQDNATRAEVATILQRFIESSK